VRSAGHGGAGGRYLRLWGLSVCVCLFVCVCVCCMCVLHVCVHVRLFNIFLASDC
jgi:hypothetical protein